MRRGKTSLLLMEQLVMLLVFALAAALCLRAFVYSDRLSRQMEARDRAADLAQNAAETLRHTAGDFPRAAGLLGAERFDETSFQLDYDGDWNLADDTMRYTLGAARADSDIPGLGRAQVWVRDEQTDQELLRLDLAWQEVSGHGA